MFIKVLQREPTCPHVCRVAHRIVLPRRMPLGCGLMLTLSGLLLAGGLAFAQPSATTDASLAADQGMLQKLAGYIDCINDHSNWVTKSRKRYFSWLKSPEKGPTGKEEIVYGLYTLQDNRR